MSRRSGTTNFRRSAAAAPSNSKLPPSHPLEHTPGHVQFLIRSLQRSDVELAAILELNQSLHACKRDIVQTCGEGTLLDLGQGIWILNPDDRTNDECPLVLSSSAAVLGKPHDSHDNTNDDHNNNDDKNPSSSITTPPPDLSTLSQAQTRLCVDFLERLQLRRKVMNRLMRRLHRLAHCMDGFDLSSLTTVPPKYGDLRLFVDQNEVQQFGTNLAKRKEALERMQARRRKKEEAPVGGDDVVVENGGGGGVSGVEETQEEAVMNEEMEGAEGTTTEIASPAMELDAEAESTTNTPQVDGDETDPTTLRLYDYQVLKEYNDAYEKALYTTGSDSATPGTTATTTHKYTILDKPHEEDYHLIKYGAGIGASHRSMSLREKEVECKRWQTVLLQGIPEQPTLEELGLQNRVFYLKERRAQLEKEKEEARKKQKENANMEMDSEGKDDQATMDVDEPDDEEHKDDKKQPEDKPAPSPKGSAKKKRRKDDEPSEAAPPPPLKISKFMSLAPTPSFHEQDKKRLLLIHADLMATSITHYARRRVEHDTLAYNGAFRRSNDLYLRRMKAEAEQNSINYEYRLKLGKMSNEFNISDAVYKARWREQKKAHDHQRAAQCMPSYWNKVALGTAVTTQATRDNTDPVRGLVARTLADMVDGVVTRHTDPSWKDRKFDAPYERPLSRNPQDAIIDPSTGETLRQRQERIELAHRRKLVQLQTALASAEDERKRAWRRMMKTKQEFDIPHQHTATVGGRRTRVNVDARQLHMLPLPPLGPTAGSSGMVATPSYAPSTMPTYMPPPVTQTAQLKIRGAYGANSDSKYSAARVMERIGSDGTVAPASEPKKGKDGLYLRPAGRSRRGMDWDAVRGVWVPSANSSG